MPAPSHHGNLALYAYDTAIIAASGKPALLFSYFDLYLTYIERWPRGQMAAINA
jgi:hypothetical protein